MGMNTMNNMYNMNMSNMSNMGHSQVSPGMSYVQSNQYVPPMSPATQSINSSLSSLDPQAQQFALMSGSNMGQYNVATTHAQQQQQQLFQLNQPQMINSINRGLMGMRNNDNNINNKQKQQQQQGTVTI